MSIAKLISWMSARHPAKRNETCSYEAIFKGSPGRSSSNQTTLANGFQVAGHDADAYFKEVFSGPVF